jgi:DNA polymerase III gamma/tau subunit
MQTDLLFSQSLAEKYRPVHIADFIGLERPKKILSAAAELHKMCNVQTIEDTVRQCWYAPMTPGGFHVVLADEADQMTSAAQLALLSKLDSTDPAPNTIWIFTANDTERLERRFLSRCKALEFSSYGLAGEIASYLDRVWHAEGGNGDGPDLARLAKDSRNNVRDCLMRLGVELMAL